MSKFERGLLPDLGCLRLLTLYHQVGLDLGPRPKGHGRTLDDVAVELNTVQQGAPVAQNTIRRVRHKKKV